MKAAGGTGFPAMTGRRGFEQLQFTARTQAESSGMLEEGPNERRAAHQKTSCRRTVDGGNSLVSLNRSLDYERFANFERNLPPAVDRSTPARKAAVVKKDHNRHTYYRRIRTMLKRSHRPLPFVLLLGALAFPALEEGRSQGTPVGQSAHAG